MNALRRLNVTMVSGIRTPGGRGVQCARREFLTAMRAGRNLTRAECLEGDDGVGVLDAGNYLHLFVDEMADVGVVVDVELDQEIVVAGGGIDLRGDLGFRKRIGNRIGLAELAFELDEKGNHRVSPEIFASIGQKWAPKASQLAANSPPR